MLFQVFSGLMFLSLFSSIQGRSTKYVTCGSVIKLLNLSYKVRLHSHDVKYGSGSGQQSITGTDVKEDVNSHWTIKGPINKTCTRGEPVKCGMTIRLQHLATSRLLHSHHFVSPLSSNQEVSAFGEGGIGDSGDNWIVVCEDEFWERDDNVSLKHVDTGMFLASSGHTYGRPINGQMEIVGIRRKDSSASWQAVEGLYIHPSVMTKTKHDEL
ncbi:stromal cell-derived factor 2-like [Artemia franciscana]|uniref:MIR domain-containing protein n=1 Tax=Artemia franciscana TaxID=6661 RepID=A0AA88I124_ARTSF|nr:hypothetical protein QYM36_009280 [Artemia franciscana]